MSKYIDAEKLIAEIERRKKQDITIRERSILIDVETAIESLQQEQPELPGIEEPGIPGKDFIPVEWVDACEMYGKWKIVKQEPEGEPEVDLVEKVTDKSRACCNCVNGITRYPNCLCWQHKYCNTDEPYKIPKEDWVETAKTCKEFELDLNARKEG